MRKYSISFTRYLILYALGFLIFFISGYIVRSFYALLAEWIPSIFALYNPVADKDAYEKAEKISALITAIISLYIATYIAVVYDNERYEYIIGRTDGFYTLGEGLRIYSLRYIPVDLLISVLVPALPIGLVFIKLPPDAPRMLLKAVDGIDGFLSIQGAFTDMFGFSGGIILLAAFSLIFRIPASYFAVRRFRGVWLSNIDG